jgi:hypothetical protein
MLIDRQARGWIVATIVMFLVATGCYVWYVQVDARARLYGPAGSTWQGLTFGIVGTAFMAFAMLLSVKKRLRTMRIGRAYWWVQGHVWLGLLAYPLILYHAGFRWGQPWGMTWWLMLLFTIIVASGVIGILLQNVIPTRMMREIPLETIYEQLDRVTDELRKEAAGIVDEVCRSREEDAYELEAIPAGAAVATVSHTGQLARGQQMVKDFFTTEIQPFLQTHVTPGNRLMKLQSANSAFDQIRLAVPRELHESVSDLQAIVDERRQLVRQRRMHHLLHGWLLIHVPLSFALTILAAVHIVVALRYL